MSTELVLLIVAFLLLPLVQFLVRAARAGQEPQPTQAPRTPSSVAKPPMREMQQILAPEDRTLTDVVTAPGRKPARKSNAGPGAPPIGTSVRRKTVVAGLGGPLDLRRAIVLRTVLGPCRASRPQDRPEGAE
jgi:hypothetical protein